MSLRLHDARGRALNLRNIAYRIHLDLRAASDSTHFGCTTTVSFDAEPGSSSFLELANARDLVIEGLPGASYDGQTGRVVLPDLASHNTVTVRASVPYVTNGDGMHRFVDAADGEVYVSAYLGMDIAHHVFACFDQPDLKATFDVTVDAPRSWTVVGNGVASTDEPGHWSFATTPTISTYLFVVCAGPWHSRSFTHAGLPFAWHARRSLAQRLDRDFDELARITTAAFDYYTAVFDEPYPFDSYDQVLVPEHNWGALETPGAVTFRDELLTPGPPTPNQELWRACLISHEMAHMWFGNLVTMVWWEDSWLNESFADFMGYDVADVAAGLSNSWVGAALTRKPLGYRADLRRSTHRIAEDPETVVDVDTAFGNFDMITYAKGNAALRQLVQWLGRDEFFDGVNRHLTRHRFGNATLDDFLQSMSEGTDRDVRGWADAWLRTSGFDTITETREAGVPVLHRTGSRPHRFTVQGFADDGALLGEREVDLDAEPVRLPEFADAAAVLPNAADETFAAITYSEPTLAWLLRHLGDLPNALTRASIWWQLMSSARSGTMTWESLHNLIARQLPVEANPTIVDGVLSAYALHAQTMLTPDEYAEGSRALIAATEAILAQRPALSAALAPTRVLATYLDDVPRLQRWLAENETDHAVPLDSDLRWQVVTRLVSLGVDPRLIEDEAQRSPGGDTPLRQRTARAAIPDPAAKAAAWSDVASGTLSNRELEASCRGLWWPGHHEIVTPQLEAYVAAGPGIAAQRGQAYSKVYGINFPLLPMPHERRRTLRDAVQAQLDAGVPTVLHRTWSDRIDDLDEAIARASA